jgi:threonine/homoserine/homoserine lactone efflux protein
MTGAFWAGCLAGLAVAVPVGAVGTLIILTAASRGLRLGAAAGLGTATADGLYAGIAVLFGAAITPVLADLAIPLRWGSAVVLALLGAGMIRSGFRRQPIENKRPSNTFATPVSAYVTVLGITVVNPTTVIYFAALIVGSPPDQINDTSSRLTFVAGVFLASAVWQVLLAGGGSVLGRVLSGSSARRWTTVVGGGAVVLLAVRSVMAT